ncbi:MAG: carboxypeptidase-like regulatory domain-containing protein [Polyangiales bacterium]
MRTAGAITGLMVLGTFVIPGTYGENQGILLQFDLPEGAGRPLSADRDLGSATLAGRIYDERGQAVAGAIVSLAGSGFWPARSVRSGTDGRFYWPNIPEGVYELQASKGELVAPPLDGLILDAGARRAFGIQLARGWTLAGQVIDAYSGEPIRDAELTVSTGVLGLHSRRARSDQAGRFELAGIIGSNHSLYVDAEGYVPTGPLLHRAEEPSMTVRLERASEIAGRVLDQRGRPVQGALVQALDDARPRAAPLATPDSLGVTFGPVPPITAAGNGTPASAGQVATAPDGSFRLTNLGAGSYRIAVSHEQFAPAESEPLRLDSGGTRAGVEIVLLSGAELAGRVVDERGNGLEGIPVELRAPAERLPRMTVTAPDGSFTFRGVRGEVSVTALPYDLTPSRASVEIGQQARVAVELALSSALYTLRGRVVDERGYGVAGALVTVSTDSARAPIHRSAKSDVDGTFAVPALPAPPYTVDAEHPAFSPARIVDIEATDGIRIVMSAGVTLLGEVLDDWNGDRLEGVRVRLDGPIRLDTLTRRDGSFVFPRSPTGTYEVSFSHADYESQTRRVVLEPPQYVDRPQELDAVRLTPGGSVEGEVQDARRDPVGNAEVTWGDPPRWERATLSDSRGAFRLRGVPAGSVWITARHPAAGEDSCASPIRVRALETSPGAFIRLPGYVAE